MALAEEVLSNYEQGARPKVPKVLLMITGGPESSNNDYETLQEVTKRLHDRHTLVLAVGILPGADIKKLQNLVQSSVNLFVAESFQGLGDQLEPLTNETCLNVGRYHTPYHTTPHHTTPHHTTPHHTTPHHTTPHHTTPHHTTPHHTTPHHTTPHHTTPYHTIP